MSFTYKFGNHYYFICPLASSENPSFGLKHAHFTLTKVKLTEEHI